MKEKKLKKILKINAKLPFEFIGNREAQGQGTGLFEIQPA